MQHRFFTDDDESTPVDTYVRQGAEGDVGSSPVPGDGGGGGDGSSDNDG